MTDEQLREEGPPSIFDYTMGDHWDDCPRKLYWFLRGVVPLEEPDYFTAGRAWQAALTKWYNSEGTQGERLAQGQAAILKTYAACQTPILDEARSHANLLNLFSLYIMQFPIEPWLFVRCELGWAYPLSDFSLGGAMDGYIRWEPYGPLVLENKTMKFYITDNTLPQFRLHLQPTQYIWGLHRTIEEEPWGCLMNIASLLIPKKETTERELFIRGIEQRSSFELLRFEEEWKGRVEGIRAQWGHPFDRWRKKYSTHLGRPIRPTWNSHWPEWSWPMTGRFCHGGYGLKSCMYSLLCAMNTPPEKTHVPGNLYTYREQWKPWERKG